MTFDDQPPERPYEDPDLWPDAEVRTDAQPTRQGPRPPRARARSAGSSPPPSPADPIDDGYEYEYVDLPREGVVPRWLAAMLVVLLVIGAAVGGLWWWYQRQVDPPGPPGGRVEVQVPEGASSSRIGSILADRDVVTNATLFNLYAGRKNAGPFQAGTYRFQKSSSFDEALMALRAGPGRPATAKTTKVTIPEGYTVAQVLDRIHERVPRLSVADLQRALDDAKVPSKLKPEGVTSYEGLLFPATYEVGDDTTAVELLTEMAAEMDKRVDRLDPAASVARVNQQWNLDMTTYDLMKVASMIQYEAAGEQDAIKIGTVTYNRLQEGIPLAYDSTSVYEAGLAGKARESIDYRVDTPYNTRTRQGLPPSPIAAPGTYGLEGAFQPIEGPWLYFVLTNNKEVTFAVTYDEFLQAKALCRQRDLGCG